MGAEFVVVAFGIVVLPSDGAARPTNRDVGSSDICCLFFCFAQGEVQVACQCCGVFAMWPIPASPPRENFLYPFLSRRGF
jgi:hypothetical protein